MPDQEPILDYASPRKRGKLRLPARSRIQWQIDPKTQNATITATLTGKDGAVAGLLFGFFTFLLISACAIAEIAALDRYPSGWPFATLCTVVALTELVLIILIIDQTWAKTTLRATREHLIFQSRSPFRRKEFSWHVGELQAIRIEDTQDDPDAARLGRIQILSDRTPPLSLFVDHLYRDLGPVLQAVLFGLGQTDTPPTRDVDPVTQMPLVQPNAENLKRLINVRREVHARVTPQNPGN